MLRESLDDLVAFVAVARARNFTRAAAQLGVSQPALSQTIRALESRLGVRLLARTTRSVAPTAAGERLLGAVAPLFHEIEAGLLDLAGSPDGDAGTLRLAAESDAAGAAVWPAVARLLRDFPDMDVELVTQLATEDGDGRFDASVRLGAAEDVTAVALGADMLLTMVAAPSYVERGSQPRDPTGLATHDCIGLRSPSGGDPEVWRFRGGGPELRVRIACRLAFTDAGLALRAALEGCGIAYLPEESARPHVGTGGLVRVLPAWHDVQPGYRLHRRAGGPNAHAVDLLLRYV